jgi:hypothetical protein
VAQDIEYLLCKSEALSSNPKSPPPTTQNKTSKKLKVGKAQEGKGKKKNLDKRGQG